VSTTLRLQFEGLERLQGAIDLDLSKPLTCLVGVNGSGKSTLLEATAEVLFFLGRYQYSGLRKNIRKDLKTHRSTSPKWDRVIVTLNTTEQVAIDSKLQRTLGETSETLDIVIGRGSSDEEWAVARVATKAGTIDFATDKLVVDSKRRQEALERKDLIETDRGEAEAAHGLKIQELSNRLNHSNAHEQNAIRQEMNERGQSFTRKDGDFRKRIDEQQAIADAGSNAALRTTDGGEVSIRAMEALRDAFAVPKVAYFHGALDFGPAIEGMRKTLLEFHKQPRQSQADSPYNSLLNRLAAMLTMDVTAKDGNVLLVNDRQLDQLSTGTYYALGFAAVCESTAEDAIIIWDEPENGLHPTFAKRICDMMQVSANRNFLIATHRTEMAPVLSARARIYKATSRRVGYTNVCSLTEAKGILQAQGLGVALGLEPARALFVANCTLWVEGPTDAIYWRHWIHSATVEDPLVEGVDFCFMYTSGKLLARLTIADSSPGHETAESFVNLLYLTGHSIVVADTDIESKDNPEFEALENEARAGKRGFIGPKARTLLKPRVQKMLQAIDSVTEKDGEVRALLVTTWGREVENSLSDDAFQRVCEAIASSSGASDSSQLKAITVDPWESYREVLVARLDAVPNIKGYVTRIHDKPTFAGLYLQSCSELTLEQSLRPEAKQIVLTVVERLRLVKQSYRQ
jgi:ABC-type multidrug transport system ATPase subunit